MKTRLIIRGSTAQLAAGFLGSRRSYRCALGWVSAATGCDTGEQRMVSTQMDRACIADALGLMGRNRASFVRDEMDGWAAYATAASRQRGTFAPINALLNRYGIKFEKV